jgi:alpha-beta hydrolase superfamily lysophospholipase
MAADGTRLAWRSWRPEHPKLALAVIHGHGEHGGRYAGLAAAMGGHDIATYAMDVRGHGSSGGARGHVLDWNQLIADSSSFIGVVRDDAAGVEVVPLGHSVGGSILLSAVIRGAAKPRRFVVSSPALRVKAPVPGWKLTLGKVASSVVPTLALATELNAEHISRDPAVVKAYTDDPQVHDKMSARFYTEWQAANREILARAAEIKIPFLATHGADDRIIDPMATDEFFRRATVEGRKLIIYPGAYHEPYNDLGREQVFADLVNWLGA